MLSLLWTLLPLAGGFLKAHPTVVVNLSHSLSPHPSFSPGPQQGCGGYLSSPTGMFGSPDIDMNGQYEPRMDCMWTIAVEINKSINLTFTSFELEGSTGTLCRYDYVKVKAGTYNITLKYSIISNTELSISLYLHLTHL